MMIPPLSIEISDLDRDLPRLVSAVERFGVEAGLDETTIFHTQLILEELATNTLTHGRQADASPQVDIKLSCLARLLTIELRDDGLPYDPLQHPSPDLETALEDRPVGGLGIHFMRRFTRSAQYAREGQWNVLRLTLDAARPDDEASTAPAPLTSP